MSQNIYKETVERYCNILGRNIKFNQYMSGENKCFECSNREECQKNGGCRHHIFSQVNSKQSFENKDQEAKNKI